MKKIVRRVQKWFVNFVWCIMWARSLYTEAAPVDCTLNETRPGPDVYEDGFFSGVWYMNSRTVWAWDSDDTWTGGIDRFSLPAGDYEYFTGRHVAFMPREGRCSPVVEIRYEFGDITGMYLTTTQIYGKRSAPSKGYFHIIFTDYSTAVVHVCHALSQNGSCDSNQREVRFLSRRANMEEAIKRRLARHLPSVCASIEDMVDQEKANCSIYNDAVNNDNEQKGNCTITSMTVTDDFHIDQLLGLWHHTAMTQFTDYGKLDSGMSFYSTPDHQAYFSYLVGAINGTCLTPVGGLTVHDRSSSRPGDLIGKLGGYENEHPWFPFRVLYSDAEHLLVYACYGQNDLGQCDPGMNQVELMTRYRDVNDTTLDLMRGLMPRVCLEPRFLDRAPATVVGTCKDRLLMTLGQKDTDDVSNSARDSIGTIGELVNIDDDSLDIDEDTPP